MPIPFPVPERTREQELEMVDFLVRSMLPIVTTDFRHLTPDDIKKRVEENKPWQ